MGVHDEVGGDALAGERHVLLVVGDATGPLLPVATGKLVSYLGDSNGADSDLAELVAVLVDRQHHLSKQGEDFRSETEVLYTVCDLYS